MCTYIQIHILMFGNGQFLRCAKKGDDVIEKKTAHHNVLGWVLCNFVKSDWKRQEVGFSDGEKPHQVGAPCMCRLIVIFVLFIGRTKKTEQNRTEPTFWTPRGPRHERESLTPGWAINLHHQLLEGSSGMWNPVGSCVRGLPVAGPARSSRPREAWAACGGRSQKKHS